MNESIGSSPAQILFGNVLQLDKGLFLPPEERVKLPRSEWIAQRLTAQDAIICRAQEIQRNRDNDHLNRNLPQVHTEFAVGDYVLVDYPQSSLKPGPPSKLMTHRRGPLRVKSRQRDQYALENLVNNKEEIVHLKRLNPLYYDPEHVDPRQVANRDSQHYDIYFVLQHRGSAKRPSNMEFLIRWMPLNEVAHKTWEPWTGVRDTIALHQYLREHDMAQIIPRKYKI